MIRRDLLTGHWLPYLEPAISLKPCYEGGINGGEVFLLAKIFYSCIFHCSNEFALDWINLYSVGCLIELHMS